ncbi:MAG: spore coat protein U domain-containing protein [Vulcanimicrobiaceae bacterium]
MLSTRRTARLLAALIAASGCAALAAPAWAGSNSANLQIAASVISDCAITTSNVNFGNYDPAVTNATTALTASGAVTITCTPGSSPVIALGPGLNAVSGQRNMKTGTSTLSYNLYQPPNTTPGSACTYTSPTAWGDGLADTGSAPTFTPTSPTSLAPRTYNVCGSIPAAQAAAISASYADTVVATVTF